MVIEKASYCKVNLILNILGRRADGFHEIETIFYPVFLPSNLTDRLIIERSNSGVRLTCSNPSLPTNSSNLVYRAAEAYLKSINFTAGVKIHLEKRLPLSSGIGGGSANAAATLLGMNELFGFPLKINELHRIAETLGADVPFFLYSQPAIASGKGEQLEQLAPFSAFQNMWILLAYPGFGVSTAWAYGELARYPELLNGIPGRARNFANLLNEKPLNEIKEEFFNAFEKPVFKKFPLIALIKGFCLNNGAIVAMMSGSGSTVFSICDSQCGAESLARKLSGRFGSTVWTAFAKL